ncbi:hypothetical protein MRB53_042147 [Persea americana]|nr:hypothetical protein MRB53_042147 [Persea americana]
MSCDCNISCIRSTTQDCQICASRCIDSSDEYVHHMSYASVEPIYWCNTHTLIRPRLPNFAAENSQSPSGVLKLIHAWSLNVSTSPFLVAFDAEIIPAAFACLAEQTVKDPVAKIVLEIAASLVGQVNDESNGLSPVIRDSLLLAHLDVFLDSTTQFLKKRDVTRPSSSKSDDIFALSLSVISSVSPLAQDAETVQRALEVLVPMINRPLKIVAASIKSDILRIIEHLLPRSADFHHNSDTLWKYYDIVTALFRSTSDNQDRSRLVEIVKVFARNDESLVIAAATVENLNAYSTRRLDTPDFDRRLAAFSALNRKQYAALEYRAWRLILNNIIFFVQDEDELAIRTNASYCIERFLEVVSARSDSQLPSLLRSILLPAVSYGLRHKTELIRSEWISILNVVVNGCPFLPEFAAMVPLTAEGDEEVNFFSNIQHIQQHRRGRALRRLSLLDKEVRLLESSITDYLLPLVEQFCFKSGGDAHNLVDDAIKAVGELASRLSLSKFINYSDDIQSF